MRVRLAILVLFASAVAVAADPLERLFSSPHLASLPADGSLSYVHHRSSARAGASGDLSEVIRIERSPDGANVIVTMDAEGRPRPTQFRGMSGNPILMVFLETVVRSISDATGGNPFYLRNRIKEAMRGRMEGRAVTADLAGAEVPAQRIELRPFEGDPHVEDLGSFAELELSFLLAEAAPGAFLSLGASTEDGDYSEEVHLDETR